VDSTLGQHVNESQADAALSALSGLNASQKVLVIDGVSVVITGFSKYVDGEPRGAATTTAAPAQCPTTQDICDGKAVCSDDLRCTCPGCKDDSSGKKTNSMVIIGAVFGCLVIAICVVIGVYFYMSAQEEARNAESYEAKNMEMDDKLGDMGGVSPTTRTGGPRVESRDSFGCLSEPYDGKLPEMGLVFTPGRTASRPSVDESEFPSPPPNVGTGTRAWPSASARGSSNATAAHPATSGRESI